jgi:hypothetical protein
MVLPIDLWISHGFPLSLLTHPQNHLILAHEGLEPVRSGPSTEAGTETFSMVRSASAFCIVYTCGTAFSQWVYTTFGRKGIHVLVVDIAVNVDALCFLSLRRVYLALQSRYRVGNGSTSEGAVEEAAYNASLNRRVAFHGDISCASSCSYQESIDMRIHCIRCGYSCGNQRT